MARVFELDVLECPRCGQKGMQRIALITQPSLIRSILASVGLATAPPERKAASPSAAVREELDFADAAGTLPDAWN